MSVANANPFDLLDDENEDPQQLANAKLAAKPAEKPAAKKAPEPKAAPAKPVEVAKPEGGRGGRGRGEGRGRGRGRGDRGADSGDVAENGFDDSGREGRGRGRGRGEGRGRGGRGSRGGGGFEGRPRGGYDRHDGTGRGYETEKRGGAGRGNWGTAQDDEATEATPAPAAEGWDASANAEAPAAQPEGEGGEAAAAPAEPAEPEVKEITLEEYEKQLAEKKAALNKAKQEVTVDTSEFAKLKVVKKEEDDLGLSVSSAKEKKGPKAKERKEVVVLETAFKVGEEQGRFGDRRGGRGGRGGGGGGASINVQDDASFPSLGN